MISVRSLALAALLFAAGPLHAQTFQDWMSPEVGDAWDDGYTGQGVSITVIDDFNSNDRFIGDLGLGNQFQTHGNWTFQQAGMIAPDADMYQKDYTSRGAVRLKRRSLNVLNLSYGIYTPSSRDPDAIRWSLQERSIISYAETGKAVVVKAAGNDAIAIGSATDDGFIDALNVALTGADSVLFVGALDTNGTTADPASLASYSNYAGTNTDVQEHFLVVGVDGDMTGLYGTSFAAPIVTGYSAILGSKFTAATPVDITNRLLDTARTDTISGYDVTIHGQGEASLTRALAPNSIR
ncbi:S8 family serine peptidase [Frigidibacter sp.]|uniref:S8 family serine peptidase n=1 Tax=Frigidibacter sp. TaxID=2586418 RepID=UPI0027351375|nr:S8 family serine peptidase [Frigidibacter sp.]